MNDINELIRQRDALNQQIKRQQEAKRRHFNDRLKELEVAVRQFAEQHGDGGDEQHRKNVTSITINDRITAKFADHEPDYSGYLAVIDTATGMQCTFDDGLPTAAALIGLLAGQLGILVTYDGGQSPA